jgi:hypothetical protein
MASSLGIYPQLSSLEILAGLADFIEMVPL